jgi:penicillin-binding protein 1C
MRLEDLAYLYAQLALPKRGRLSPEACWLTLNALRATEPGAPIGLSYKTGTSNGFRDAWACGVIGDWVLCVWIGHFSGRGMPGLFASQTAAPLLWQTASRLRLPEPSAAISRPKDVVPVRVCSVSGDLVGEHCPHHRDEWFIGGVSPITSCKVHQRDGDRVVEVWSANRLEQFRKAGFPRANSLRDVSSERQQQIAAHGAAPEILSPQAALTYYIQSGDDDQNRIQLEAHAAAGTRQIHWFADRRYLGASAPAEPMPWQPAAGDYELQAMDDSGRAATRRVRVRLALAE